MRRSELADGMEVALQRPGLAKERAIIVDLSPGWVTGKDKFPVPWTAYTGPEDGAFMRKTETGQMRWGPRFEILSKRNQNVAVALEIRKRTGLGYETEHQRWEPAVIPLSQVEQPWAQWEATLTAQQVADAERNAALHKQKGIRKSKWERIEPTIKRCTIVNRGAIARIGEDYIDPRHHTLTVPKQLIEDLVQTILNLEAQ